MAQLIVEVRNQHQQGSRYYSIDVASCSIGRAFDNDIIINEPHMDPHHLQVQVTEQGVQLAIGDSVNGVWKDRQQLKHTQLELASGEAVHVGHVQLFFYLPDHPVAPARLLHDTARGMREGARIMSQIVAVLVFLVIVQAYASFNESSNEVHWYKLIADTLPVITGVTLWAGIWAIVSYMVHRKLNFTYLLAVTVAFYTMDSYSDIVISYASYNIHSQLLGDILRYLVGGGILAFMLFAIFSRVLTVSRKSKLLVANILTWSFIGILVFLIHANELEFRNKPEYSEELKPPAWKWNSSISKDQFLRDAKVVFNQPLIPEEESHD